MNVCKTHILVILYNEWLQKLGTDLDWEYK